MASRADSELNPEREPSAAERRDFEKTLAEFFRKRGKNFPRVPVLGHKQLDLLRLFRLVVSRGGLERVVNKSGWKEIARLLDLPPTCTNYGYALRSNYEKFLFAYEQVCVFGIDNADHDVTFKRAMTSGYQSTLAAVPEDFLGRRVKRGVERQELANAAMVEKDSLPNVPDLSAYEEPFENMGVEVDEEERERRFGGEDKLPKSCNYWNFRTPIERLSLVHVDLSSKDIAMLPRSLESELEDEQNWATLALLQASVDPEGNGAEYDKKRRGSRAPSLLIGEIPGLLESVVDALVHFWKDFEDEDKRFRSDKTVSYGVPEFILAYGTTRSRFCLRNALNLATALRNMSFVDANMPLLASYTPLIEFAIMRTNYKGGSRPENAPLPSNMFEDTGVFGDDARRLMFIEMTDLLSNSFQRIALHVKPVSFEGDSLLQPLFDHLLSVITLELQIEHRAIGAAVELFARLVSLPRYLTAIERRLQDYSGLSNLLASFLRPNVLYAKELRFSPLLLHAALSLTIALAKSGSVELQAIVVRNKQIIRSCVSLVQMRLDMRSMYVDNEFDPNFRAFYEKIGLVFENVAGCRGGKQALAPHENVILQLAMSKSFDTLANACSNALHKLSADEPDEELAAEAEARKRAAEAQAAAEAEAEALAEKESKESKTPSGRLRLRRKRMKLGEGTPMTELVKH